MTDGRTKTYAAFAGSWILPVVDERLPDRPEPYAAGEAVCASGSVLSSADIRISTQGNSR